VGGGRLPSRVKQSTVTILPVCRIAPVDDAPTLRQRVQHALFVFRDVHWNAPSS
jgi:hypothetical protein